MSSQLSIGRTLGKYTVEAEIGRGGMAAVYRVRHAQLGSLHALKVLELQQPGMRERFLQEGRVQATLRHPNIATVTDVLDVDGASALVMELVEGPDLERWLREQRPSPELVLEIFGQIVTGVAEAHAHGVVHRDLKPGNVLMARSRTGQWIPKVADFGLTKLADRPTDSAATRAGIAMGTPSYMPPEQIANARDVDHRADIWALGCILYELLAGHRCFEGEDLVEILTDVKAGRYAPVQDAPAHLATLVDHCLQIDPEDRPASCLEVLEALEAPPEPVDLPPSLPPPPPAPPPRELARTLGSPVSLAVAGGVGLVTVGGMVLVLLIGALGVGSLVGGSDPCGAWSGQKVGYLYLGRQLVAPLPGQTITLRSDVDVVGYVPEPEDEEPGVVCVLPRGTRVTFSEPAVRVRGRGVYHPIVGGSYELPDEE